MRYLITCLVLVASFASVAQKNKKQTTEPLSPILLSSIDSFSYAVGMNVAQNLKSQGFDTISGAFLVKGVKDVYSGKKLLMTEDMANQTIQQTMQAFMAKKSAASKEKEQAFCNENKKRKEVVELPSGLQYEILRAGDPAGIKPRSEDTVVVNYKGTLLDGTEFDNSYKRGEPATFPVNGVIRGWTEILQQMSKGANWKVYIPAQLAYGERGAGASVPPNSTLIFEIDLLDIKPAAGK